MRVGSVEVSILLWIAFISVQNMKVEFLNLPHSRLLGPSAAADVLQLTNTLSAGGGGQARFHLVTDNDIRVMTRDEDMFDDLFQVSTTFHTTVKSLILDAPNPNS